MDLDLYIFLNIFDLTQTPSLMMLDDFQSIEKKNGLHIY